MKHPLLLLVLVLLPSVLAVRFGLSQTLTAYNPSQSDRAALGRRIKDGVDFWHYKLGSAQGFDYLALDDQGNSTLLNLNYQSLLSNPSVDYLLGPEGSDFSLLVKPLTDAQQRLYLATSSGSDSISTGQWSFSVLTPASRALASVFGPLRSKGARTVAYITEAHPFTTGACYSIPSLASAVGISLLKGTNLTFYASGNLTYSQKDEVEDALLHIKHLRPDILVLGMFPPTGFYAVRTLRRLNYMPKAVIIAPMLIEWEGNPLAEYLEGIEEWVPQVTYPADSWYGSSADYVSQFQSRYGYVPSSYNVMGSVSALLLQLAVQASANSSQAAVRNALKAGSYNLFWGPMGYTSNDACLKNTVVFQMFNGSRVPVAPAATAIRSIVYPIPKWHHRGSHTHDEDCDDDE